MNIKKIEDLEMGEKYETYIKQIIINKWNIADLQKTDKFNPMDFYSKEQNIYFEIKARRNTHDKYATTMIGLNKVEYAKKQNATHYFIFSFTDGDYYYKFDINDNLEISKGGRYDRGRPEFKQYVFIPINKLIKI